MAGSVGDVNNYRRPFPTVITLNYIVYIVNFFLAAFGWKSVAPWEPPEGTFWGTLWAFLRIVGQNSLVLPIFNQLTLIYIWVCLNIEYNPPNGCFKREYDNQPMVILMGTVFSDKPIFFLFLFLVKYLLLLVGVQFLRSCMALLKFLGRTKKQDFGCWIHRHSVGFCSFPMVWHTQLLAEYLHTAWECVWSLSFPCAVRCIPLNMGMGD